MIYIKLFDNHYDNMSEIEEIEDYFLELYNNIHVDICNHQVHKREKTEEYANKPSGQRWTKQKWDHKYIPGFKISITFASNEKDYIKSVVDQALKRLMKYYHIHYNQVSEGPYYSVHIITISRRKLNESLKDNELDIIEDFLDMTNYNKELTITGQYKHTFDIFTKNIIGDNSKIKQEILYGNITNADIMKSKSESVVNCIVALIKFTNNDAYWLNNRLIISKTFLLSRFKRLILLCPNVVIFYKIISLGSEFARSETFEFVFFIDPTK